MNKTIKEVAEAVAFLHYELIDMGDSFKDDVEMLCDLAKIECNSEKTYEDDNYLYEKCKEAYEILFAVPKYKYVDCFTKTLVEYKEYLLNKLKFYDCNDILQHPMFKAILVFASFVAQENNVNAKKEMEKILWDFMEIDMEVVSLGYKISSEYWKHLDNFYYFISNTASKVGSVSCCDEEKKYGDYISHNFMKNPREYGYFDCGYIVCFVKEKGNIIAKLYKQTKANIDMPFNLKKTDVAISVNNNIETCAKQIAYEINKLTKTDFKSNMNL